MLLPALALQLRCQLRDQCASFLLPVISVSWPAGWSGAGGRGPGTGWRVELGIPRGFLGPDQLLGGREEKSFLDLQREESLWK